MSLKSFKPTSPALRQMTVSSFEELTKKKPEKSLIKPLNKKSGRNNHGRITVRHRGGRQKRLYRIIDFKRNKDGITANVSSIEYDPNRNAYIALLYYIDGEKKYILAPEGLKVGEKIISGEKAEVKIGNALFLKDIPVGTLIHNIEMKPGKGGQLARSAGNYAQLMAKEEKYAQIRMPSSEVRMIFLNCKATIGKIGNENYNNITIGKAGRKRHLGFRPTVRGVVMNPNDHPHGGGEGKSPVGRKHPVTPWGKVATGKKTRKKNKISNKFIIRRRKKNN